MEAYPITVGLLQLFGSLLKKAGSRSAGACLSVVKNQHIRLGFPWSDALDLDLREGKRACERGTGPPRKRGAFDMRNCPTSKSPRKSNVVAGEHFMRLLVGDARGRVVELSTAQVVDAV